MKKCYIVGAADFAPARFRPGPDDLVIAADAGCLHLERLGLRPDIILGDLTRWAACRTSRTWRSPRAQGRHGLHARRTAGHRARLRYAALLRLPGGKRLDHTIANIQTIAWAASEGAAACLIGNGCCLTALRGGESLTFDARYSGDFSVFCLGADAQGVTERRLNYTLEGAELTAHFPLGVSNAFIGESAYISLESGVLIVYWADNPELPLPERGRLL